MKAFEHLRTKIIHIGKVLELRTDTILTHQKKEVDYEYISYPDVVVVLGINDDGNIIMVRQYRPAIRTFLLELPAGKMDANEEPLQAAQREFEEETGYVAEKWTPITEFYSAPGFCTEYLYLFLAENLTRTNTHFDEDEDLENEFIPPWEIESLINNKKVVDAKSLIGLLWAQTNLNPSA